MLPVHSATTASALSASVAVPADVPPTQPLKVHIFVDGTWLFYSLVIGRSGSDRSCPMEKAFGPKWRTTHCISWPMLPRVVATQLSKQLKLQHGSQRAVEVVRTSIFTSALENTPIQGLRATTIDEWYRSNFEVHLLKTPERKEGEKAQEKCVDIMIAVEMLYMATVPNAYDVAVLITGDKDFIPALQKTRQAAKRCAIASVRNSCNKDLTRHDLHIRDFDLIWLEDHLAGFMVAKHSFQLPVHVSDRLRQLVCSHLQALPGQRSSSREVGRFLQMHNVRQGPDDGETNALVVLKQAHGSLRAFLETHDEFRVFLMPDNNLEYGIQWVGKGAGRVEEEDEGVGKEVGDVVGGAGEDLGAETDSEFSSVGDLSREEDLGDVEVRLADMSATELRAEAKVRGLTVRSKSTKADIRAAILEAAKATPRRKEGPRAGGSGGGSSGGSQPIEVVASATSSIDATDNAKVIGEIREFLACCTDRRINSRDLGRFLQSRGYLESIKKKYASLRVYIATIGSGVVISGTDSPRGKVFTVELQN